MKVRGIDSATKLFAIDIDGTLLDKNHRITPRTLNSIQKLKEHAYISLVSARPLPSVLQIARSIGADGPMVALNGGIISDLDDNIYLRRPLSIDGIEDIIQSLGNHPEISLNFYSGMKWVVSRVDARVEDEARILGFSYDDVIPRQKIVEWAKDNPIEKVLILHDNDAKSDIDSWRTGSRHSMNMAYSKSGYFEVTPAGSDKASALQYLANHYNLPLDQTVSIGDGHVDIPMLKVAGIAVVMGNAADEIKGFGDIIIGDHNEDGLAVYLETCAPDYNTSYKPEKRELTC